VSFCAGERESPAFFTAPFEKIWPSREWERKALQAAFLCGTVTPRTRTHRETAIPRRLGFSCRSNIDYYGGSKTIV
jgi:hypothetical protein